MDCLWAQRHHTGGYNWREADDKGTLTSAKPKDLHYTQHAVQTCGWAWTRDMEEQVYVSSYRAEHLARWTGRPEKRSSRNAGGTSNGAHTPCWSWNCVLGSVMVHSSPVFPHGYPLHMDLVVAVGGTEGQTGERFTRKDLEDFLTN